MIAININGDYQGIPHILSCKAVLTLTRGTFLPFIEHRAPRVVRVHEKFLAPRICI